MVEYSIMEKVIYTVCYKAAKKQISNYKKGRLDKMQNRYF